MNSKTSLRKGVFFPAFLLVLGAGVVGLVNNKLLINCFQAVFNWSYVNLSWMYQFIMAALFVLCCLLLFSRKGDLRIGGKDAKPKYSFWTWFAMSLTGGIGASIVSSGVSQPITFLESVWGELEGYGIEPGSSEAVLFALGRTFHEWAFFPYAFYGMCGVLIAYVCYNKKKPLTISSTLSPLFGDKASRPGVAALVDMSAVLALALAIVGTLGTFIGLVPSCLKQVYGLTVGAPVMFAVMAVTTVMYLLSSLSGVDKGIKFFARLNFKFYMLLLLVVALLGGSLAWILNAGTSSLGYWLQNLPLWTFDTGTAGGENLIKWWTIYNWTFWMAFAPVTGVFLAQLSYGHTIREVLIVNWIMPSLFAVVWFSVFGGCAIDWQLSGVVDLAAVMQENGTYAAIWSFIRQLPLSAVLVPVTLFVMLISFSTSADNSITVISALCMRGRRIGDEAPAPVKIAWGVAIGLLSFLLMAYASGGKGNDGVRYMVVSIGSVFSILIILQIAAAVKVFFFPSRSEDEADISQ